MKLTIRHVTRYAYEPETGQVGLRLKLFPANSDAQTVHSWKVTVNDAPVTPLHTDGAGDGIALWLAYVPTEQVEIAVEGLVETADVAGVLSGKGEVTRPGVYLRQTRATKPNDAIRELADKIEGDDTLARMHSLSALVHAAIDYRPGATESGTTAAEALALGAGVCQDQAHVFLSAARVAGVPARYVVGYLDDPDSDIPPDETHAWVEAYVKGLGWVGFDVTNEVCPTEAYVRLCSGLDAADAAPIRGTFMGDVDETMDVDIAVTPGQRQSQSQS